MRETGRGLPDISILPQLAAALSVTVPELLTGDVAENRNVSANMKRSHFYVCPICGNVIHAMGEGAFSCCGVRLPALEGEAPDAEHGIRVEDVEDELLLTVNHPMEKGHFIAGLLEVGYDRFALVRMYPEGGREMYLPRLPGGKIFMICARDGMFAHR